jgi:hypothetical protein
MCNFRIATIIYFIFSDFVYTRQSFVISGSFLYCSESLKLALRIASMLYYWMRLHIRIAYTTLTRGGVFHEQSYLRHIGACYFSYLFWLYC